MSSDSDFAGSVAVITGAARGIGASTAARFAAHGAAVAILDSDEEGAAASARMLEDEGAKALAVRCDVTSRSDVQSAMDQVVDEFGRLDILVNNAGVTRDNLLFKMTDEEWDLVLGTHLKGSFLCSQIAERHMVEQKYGRIVCVASRALQGNRGQSNYSAAKAGMTGLVKTMAIELGPFGITVNAVAPGFIETAMTRAVSERTGVPYDEYKANAVGLNSIKRAGTPEDIAAAIAFFAGHDAGYVTGQVLFVAGRPVS